MTHEPESKLVKSAQRTIEILEILGAAREPMSVIDLHRRTGYPRSSLHQLLHTLLAMRWIEANADGSTVGIGPHALLTGTAYLDRDPALPYATHTLELIRDKVNYTTHYARLDRANVIYLATRETVEPRRAVSRVGRQLPAHATALGKALLSELTPREVTALLPEPPLARLTANTITDLDELLLDLERTRVRGHSTEHEQNVLGIGCVGIAVPYRIPATDAISCSIPVAAATDDEMERVAEVIREHAQQLAARLRSEGIR